MTMDCCFVHRQFNFTQQNRNFLLSFLLLSIILLMIMLLCSNSLSSLLLLLLLAATTFKSFFFLFFWSWRSQSTMTIFLAFIGWRWTFFLWFFCGMIWQKWGSWRKKFKTRYGKLQKIVSKMIKVSLQRPVSRVSSSWGFPRIPKCN